MSNILSVSDLAVTGNISNTINNLIDKNIGVSVGGLRCTANNINYNADEDWIIPEYQLTSQGADPIPLRRYNHGVERIPTNEFFNSMQASLCPVSSYSAAIMLVDFTVSTLSSYESDTANCTFLLRSEKINLTNGTVVNRSDETHCRIRPTGIPKKFTSFSMHAFTPTYYNKDNENIVKRFYLQSQSKRVVFNEINLTLILLKGRY